MENPPSGKIDANTRWSRPPVTSLDNDTPSKGGRKDRHSSTKAAKQLTTVDGPIPKEVPQSTEDLSEFVTLLKQAYLESGKKRNDAAKCLGLDNEFWLFAGPGPDLINYCIYLIVFDHLFPELMFMEPNEKWERRLTVLPRVFESLNVRLSRLEPTVAPAPATIAPTATDGDPIAAVHKGADNVSDRVPFGQRLQTLRKSACLTQVQMAERVGVTQSNLSKMERGEIVPAFGTLFSIAKVLRVPVSALFEGVSE